MSGQQRTDVLGLDVLIFGWSHSEWRSAMKSKKASARVTSPNQETAGAAGAASRATQRKAIGSAAVENVAKRQFEKTASRAIQAHTHASGQRRQARRDSR
jgi:hypothetical protein